MPTPEAAGERLLDRENELSAITTALDAAHEGTGTLLVLEGGAGIGKTRLLSHALELAAQRGMRCAFAVGGELERELPFGVVRQLFEPVLHRAAPGEREGLFDGAAGLAAAAVDPLADPTEAPATFATLHGLYWLTANLAGETPLVLAIDDAHWADSPSLRYLIYLTRRLEGLPVLVAVAIRTGEPAPEDELVAAVADADGARVLRPAALGESSVATLIEDGLGDAPAPEFTRACHAATQGNPFLARELVVELGERAVSPGASEAQGVATMAPEAVSRAVLRRIARLPDGAADVASAVAILNGGADLALAARVAELAPDRTAQLVDALAKAGLIERGTPLRFVHPLVRAAVANAIGTGELDSAHRRAAAALDHHGGDGDRVAAHLAAARPAGEAWVVEKLVTAARRATARGAPDGAVEYLRRALAEPPQPAARGDLLLELGRTELRAGDPSAVTDLEQARGEASDAMESARAALALGQALAAFGRFSDAVHVFADGIDVLGDADPGLALELEADMLAASPLSLSTRTVALDRMRDIGDEVTPDSPAACKLLGTLAREELARLGSRERALALAERSLEGGFLLAEDPVPTFPYASVVFTFAGELDRAVQTYDETLARARERGAVLSVALNVALRGLALRHRGDLAEAAADTREALDTADAYGALPISEFAAGFLAWALIAQGETAEAEELLRRLDEPARTADSFTGNVALRVRGALRLDQGRPDDAVADLREHGRRLEAWRIRNPDMSYRGDLALAEHQLGHAEEASEVAARYLDDARSWGAPWLLADALRVAGVLAGEARGPELLRESIAVARAGSARLDEARALTELGALMRRAGARRESREPLREGLELALACGARPLAERGHTELVASGAQPRRLRETGPDALTPAERRVAGMAAGGMTNRAIAQALFVSEKTVETHLRAVFRKLDVASRSQLAGRLEPAVAG